MLSYTQVCVPFLLLSLGLDPKIDTDNFMSRFHAFNTRTVAKETTSEKAPKEKENVSKETPKEKSAVSAENSEVCGCGQISGNMQFFHAVIGRDGIYKVNGVIIPGRGVKVQSRRPIEVCTLDSGKSVCVWRGRG